MKIKKYIVRDMHEALKLIREELGPEAVIISNYRLPRRSLFDFFSPRLMEVTAAVDEHKKTVYSGTPRLGEGDQSARKLLQILREFDSGGSLRGSAGDRRDGFGLIPGQERKGLQPGKRNEVPFDIILKNEGNSPLNREINQQWKKILVSLDINESIVENLLISLRDALTVRDGSIGPGERYEAYLIVLCSKIARLLEPAYRPAPGRRICSFVGPAGDGKTLTLAKLATHYKVYENKQVALISANQNGGRPGRLETLRFYGGLIDSPVESACSGEELAAAVERHADKDLILIDTTGASSRSTGMMLRLNKLLQPLSGRQDIYLVLNSATKGTDLMRTALEYQKIGYSRFIFTKLDETDTCGSMLNLVCRTGVPVSFVSYGQNVPDDIVAVNPKKLAGLLLGGVDRYVEQGLQI